MSLKEDSDIHLKNLRDENDVPNQGKKKKKNKKTRKPNRGGKARISARRIGGDMGVDFEAYRAAKAKLGPKSKMKSVDIANEKNSSVQTVKSNRPRNSGRINATLPRVQELGSTPSMSSIPLRKNSRQNTTVGRRRFSSGSNVSNAVTEGTTHNSNNKEVIIRYGELQKRGVVTAQWKRRFFVLTHKHLFYFQEAFDVPQSFSQIDIQPKGQIDLAGVNNVNKDKNDLNGATFQIMTPSRTYKLRIEAEPTPKQLSNGISAQSLSKYYADAWVSALKGACENAKQHNNHTRLARGSFSSMKVDEMDDANLNKSSFMHPARRIINSEVQLKSKAEPHEPAKIDEVQDWTPFDVAAWLYTVHFQKYSEEFYKQGVDGKVLKTLADECMSKLKEMGVEDEDVEDLTEAVKDLLKRTGVDGDN